MPKMPEQNRCDYTHLPVSASEDVKLKLLESKMIPRDLSAEELATAVSTEGYLYVWDEGKSKKITSEHFLAQAKSLAFRIVEVLPTEHQDVNVIYLVKIAEPETADNIYREYIWVNKGTAQDPSFAWEVIGATAVDLTAYRKAADQDVIDAGKQALISDLDVIRAGAAKGATAIQSLDGYATEQWVLDKNYLTQHQDISGKADKADYELTKEKLNTALANGNVENGDDQQKWIANHAFVNSTVQTGTATFRGNFAFFKNDAYPNDSLYYYSGEKKNNDYAVVNQDETHQQQTWRYKYDGSRWLDEYKINDTPFTDAQKNALNSTITLQKVTAYDGYAAGKQDVISDLAAIRSGATLGSTAIQPSALADYAKIAYVDEKDAAVKTWVGEQGYLKAADIASKADKTYVDAELAKKQDIISDLDTIRAGAALGTTAVQPEAGKGLFSGNYNDLTNKPTIPTVPTNISAFTNDVGYLTEHQSLAAYRTAEAQNGIDDGFDRRLDTIEVDYLKAADKTELQTAINGKQATISDLQTIRDGAALGATSVQPSAIADMATKTWVGQQNFLTTSVLSNYSTTAKMNEAIAAHHDSTKVNVEEGKGLSSNDYTNAEKSKLGNIAENAQVNVLETVKVGGTALPITNKAVNIETESLSGLLGNGLTLSEGKIILNISSEFKFDADGKLCLNLSNAEDQSF